MNEKYTKRWFWHRELDRDELIKRKMATGLPEPEAVSLVRPCDRRVRMVSTRLYWWKGANRFDVNFGIDGNEGEYHFWFILPWLFGIAITVGCNWDWFKRRYPALVKDGADLSYGVGLSRSYISVHWGDRDTGSSFERRGFHWIKDWGDLLRGDNTSVEWGKAELVYEKDHRLRVVYRSNRHPVVPHYQSTRIRVYKKVGVWHFSRWFPKRHTRWEVECDQVFTMPGKGENSWDCEDDTWGGYNFDAERQSCNFSSGAKTVDAAVQGFIESFNKYQRQGM